MAAWRHLPNHCGDKEMNYFRDTAILIGGIVLIASLIIGFAIAMSVITGPITCRARWEGSGHAVQWTFMGDCRVEIHGKFVPEDAVRRIDL